MNDIHFVYHKTRHLLLLLLLLTGCFSTHFTVAEAKWVQKNATHISQVKELLGEPERGFSGRSYMEARYIDKAHHWVVLGAIPGVNLITLPIWLGEAIFFNHDRRLIIQYDESTGRISDVQYHEGEFHDRY